MSVLSEILYNERLKQGLTISDISKKTNIRKYYIVAIEEGDFNKLPGAVYARGFISNYAKVLGLNPELLISEYKKEINLDVNNNNSSLLKEQSLNTKDPTILNNNGRIGKNKSLILKVTILILIIIAVVSLFTSFNIVDHNANEKKDYSSEFNGLNNQISNKKIVETKLNTSLTNKVNNLLGIKIIANDKCWTEIEVDGKRKFYGMLNKGDQEIWNGKKIFIKLGNINAVDIYINNKKYLPTEKEIKNIVVEKNFYINVE